MRATEQALAAAEAGVVAKATRRRFTVEYKGLTPADVHHGLADERVAARASVLARAYAAHPERFLSGAPHPPARPVELWINPPVTQPREETSGAWQLAAVSLIIRDLRHYSRVTVPTFASPNARRPRHEVSPVPSR